ncbi:MAG: DUF2625 domain-containing protein [Bifidobacteriaceae bacterium]|jgi:hypothetical protein|nr:DUF2625 domain-containing protein [Bifidobacteriaceae bacterium]
MSEDVWNGIPGWVRQAGHDVKMLAGEPAAGAATLRRLGVTTRSALGAIALHSGGWLVDQSWIRVLGGTPSPGFPDIASASGVPWDASGPLASPGLGALPAVGLCDHWEMAQRFSSGWRRVIGGVLLAAVALSLGGCMKIQSELTINPDETFDADVIIAYNIKETAEFAKKGDLTIDEWLVRFEAEDGIGLVANELGIPRSRIEDYKSGGYAGWRLRLTESTPFADAEAEMPEGAAVELVREGDDFILTADLSNAIMQVSGSQFTGPPQDPIAREIQEAIYENIYVFPGKVKSTTVGKIDGNRVIWRNSFGKTEPVRIVASAKPDFFLQHKTAVLIAGPALALIILVLIGRALARRGSRRRAAAKVASAPRLAPISATSSFSGGAPGAFQPVGLQSTVLSPTGFQTAGPQAAPVFGPVGPAFLSASFGPVSGAVQAPGQLPALAPAAPAGAALPSQGFMPFPPQPQAPAQPAAAPATPAFAAQGFAVLPQQLGAAAGPTFVPPTAAPTAAFTGQGFAVLPQQPQAGAIGPTLVPPAAAPTAAFPDQGFAPFPQEQPPPAQSPVSPAPVAPAWPTAAFQPEGQFSFGLPGDQAQ